jgi:hypothetical protein
MKRKWRICLAKQIFASEDRRPLTPIGAYKEIIDQLATETSVGISERLVLEHGIFSKAQDDEEPNSFVQSLSTEERRTLSQMLHAERISAIGDVLATLEWWIVARGVGLSYRGEPMPTQFAEGISADYVGRLDDWEWPS